MALPSLFRWGRGSEVPVRRNPESNPIAELHSEMNRLFEDFWRGFGGASGAWPEVAWTGFQPRIDVEDTADEIRITAELPGMEEKDFELSLERDVLVLRGEKRAERSAEGRGLAQECLHGSFERRIALPCEVDPDRVSARHRQGVLSVRLPKSEEARRHAVAIPVRTG